MPRDAGFRQLGLKAYSTEGVGRDMLLYYALELILASSWKRMLKIVNLIFVDIFGPNFKREMPHDKYPDHT